MPTTTLNKGSSPMRESMLTTIDNPHHPFNEFDAWYAWDEGKGYHTSSFLARILTSSEDLSDADQNVANEAAIDEIITQNVSGLYSKVSRDRVDDLEAV